MPTETLVERTAKGNDELERLLKHAQTACKERDEARARVKDLRQRLPAMQSKLTGAHYLDDHEDAIKLEGEIEKTERELRREILMRNELTNRAVAWGKAFVDSLIAVETAQFANLRDEIAAAEAEVDRLEPDPYRIKGTPEQESAVLRPLREAKHRANQLHDKLEWAKGDSCARHREQWMEQLLGQNYLVKD